MSSVTIEKVTFNPRKVKEVRGDHSREAFAKITGVSAQMLDKIERGERWTQTLGRFGEFCRRTNQEPNAFFEIVKKIS